MTSERDARPYACSQEPHPGVEYYGLHGECGECGYRPTVPCDIFVRSFVEKVREDTGLALTEQRPHAHEWGETTTKCAEPATVDVVMWDTCEERLIPMCLTHALGLALHAIESTPKRPSRDGIARPAPNHLADCMPFSAGDSERTYWFCVAGCEVGPHEREAHDATCPDSIDRGFCAHVDANRPTLCPYWPGGAA